MNISELVKDGVKYPFSDWKKILILGIIIVFSSIDVIESFLGAITHNVLLVVLGFLISFLINGYTFRIIKSSLKGVAVLPKFNAWVEMFKDGIKVFIVGTVYLIPVILIVLIFSGNFNTLGYGPITIFGTYSEHVIRALIGGQINVIIAKAGIWFFITILYSFIIIPVYYMALANMANNNSKLTAAFRLRDVFNKIASIGLKNLIAFYIVTIIPFTRYYILLTSLEWVFSV
jgi:hypothetical protein